MQVAFPRERPLRASPRPAMLTSISTVVLYMLPNDDLAKRNH